VDWDPGDKRERAALNRSSKSMSTSGAIEIRNVRAEKGGQARGFLDIGETAGGAIRIPLVIVNGEEEGPILCLTAGVHATEYAAIDAVMRTIKGLDPKQMRGAVIAVPVVSMAMFESRMPFVSPLDGLNLNKIAPGSPSGSASEILAHVLLTEIIGAAQYHIDLHGGDFGELLLPFAAYALTGNLDQDRIGGDVVRAYSPGLFVLSVEGSTVPPFPGSLVYAASRKGIISILAEAGGDNMLEEQDVCIHMNGVANVMRYLRMISGEMETRADLSTATDRFVTRATRSGLLHLKVTIGQQVSAGQEVAEICDVFGKTVEVVRTKRGGVAGLIWTHKVVNTGDPIIRCWIVEPDDRT
jgi:hypothetical protein